jgi:hypothetical protein
MTEKKTLLELLLEELPHSFPRLSQDLVTRVFKAEERVQFDGDRADIASKIKEIVQANIEKETFKGDKHEAH